MDDAGGVDRAQRIDQSVSQVGQVSGVGGQVVDALVLYLVLEGGALDELGDDEGDAQGAVPGLDVQDAGHARVSHPGQDAGLAVQTAPGRGVRGDLGMEDLHGHVAAALVGGLPHHAHSSGAQTTQKPVTPHQGSSAQFAQGDRFARVRVDVLRHGSHSTGPFRLVGAPHLWGCSPDCGPYRGEKPVLAPIPGGRAARCQRRGWGGLHRPECRYGRAASGAMGGASVDAGASSAGRPRFCRGFVDQVASFLRHNRKRLL